MVKILIIILAIIGIISLVVFLYNRNHKTPIMERKVESYTEYFNSIISNDNNFIIVGSNDHNLNKYEKASISKYDMNRNKLLEKVYNKGYNSTYYDVLKDGDNYVVVGSYESTKDELENSLRTAFIVKYDKDFNVLFEDDFPVVSDSYYNRVIRLDDGYIVLGYSKSITKKDKNNGSVIIKYDFNGKELFMKYLDDNTYYNDVLYLNGYLYLCGNNKITTLDLFGNLTNTISYDNVRFNSIINVEDKIYLSGTYTDTKNKGIVVSYDMNLIKLNEVIYDKYGDTRFNKLLLDEDSIVVVGETYYYDEERISDSIIGKYTLDLKEKSVIRYNGNRNAKFKNIIKKDDKYIVIGSYDDNESVVSKFFIFSSSLKNLGA